jgi:hypothetical protein
MWLVEGKNEKRRKKRRGVGVDLPHPTLTAFSV